MSISHNKYHKIFHELLSEHNFFPAWVHLLQGGNVQSTIMGINYAGKYSCWYSKKEKKKSLQRTPASKNSSSL